MMATVKRWAMLAALLAAAWAGYSYRDARCSAATSAALADLLRQVADNEASARATERAQDAISTEAGHSYQLREIERQRAAESALIGVYRYVSTDDSRIDDCLVPAEWLRIKNAAATGQPASISDPAPGPDGAATGQP